MTNVIPFTNLRDPLQFTRATQGGGYPSRSVALHPQSWRGPTARLPDTRRIKGYACLAAAALVAIGFVALVTPAHAHDFWINHGGYKNDDGVHCCGENDCKALDPESVQVGPNGYSLILMGSDGRFVTELVPFSEAQPSEDGDYWRCKRYDGSRRCFFAPIPGY